MIQLISLSFLHHKNCENESEFSKELYSKYEVLVNETFTQQLSIGMLKQLKNRECLWMQYNLHKGTR